MKLLKKVLLVTVATTILTSCSSSQKKESYGSEDKESLNTSVVSDGILDLGTSADLPPYEFYDDNKNIVGIDADIAKEIGKKMGIKVQLKDMDFSSILASIESGKLDGGIAGLSKTPEREKNVNFSDTYAKSVQKVLVKKDSSINNPEDLKGKKIASQLGTTGESVAKEFYGEDNVQSFAKTNDAVIALSSGKIDAIVLDEETVKNFSNSNDKLEILDKSLAEDEYAIALDKKNTKLQEEVNKAIKELKEDGTIDKIINKYMENK